MQLKGIRSDIEMSMYVVFGGLGRIRIGSANSPARELRWCRKWGKGKFKTMAMDNNWMLREQECVASLHILA